MSDLVQRVAKALCRHGEPDCWKNHVEDAERAIRAMPVEALIRTLTDDERTKVFLDLARPTPKGL